MNGKKDMNSALGLRLTGLCLVLAILSPARGVCPRGAVEVTGVPDKCFSLSAPTDTLSFDDARKQCIKYEGKLYEPESDEEMSKVETTFTFKFGPGTDKKWYWLGYAKIQYVIEGSWDSPVEEPYWGSISTFKEKSENLTWNSADPDDNLGQHCALKRALMPIKMFSFWCYDKNLYICEFSLSTFRSG
ncbi:uncharacterized protein LOC142348422 [Convolutriloba macropyga]|uniref:uncharacterized protein LOC142348422 n=1 Tax=Convolutriloba macropyga TaxID=536237 RepID=UPI003F5210FB